MYVITLVDDLQIDIYTFKELLDYNDLLWEYG